MSGNAVVFEIDRHVATITLNRPENRNSMTPEVLAGFGEAIAKVRKDRDVRALVITGRGKSFCAGADFRSQQGGAVVEGDAGPLPFERALEMYAPFLSVLDVEVPVIGALNGHAIGAGCDLACMCDIRVASESAKFAESFVKLGIIPGDGGAWLLPRIVGFSKATELALTGEMIDAAEALRIGLVSEVVAPEELIATARRIADKIAANPPHAVRMTKRLLREGQTAELKNILEMSAAMQALAHATADNDEAINAFMEKRAPKFTGE